MKEVKEKKQFIGNEKGVWWPVDLNNVIEAVYVSPDSPQWFYDLTVNICSKYDLKCPVVNSRLAGKPIY